LYNSDNKMENIEPFFSLVNCINIPIWRRKKSELEDKDYKDFYRESIIENIKEKVNKDPLCYVHKKFIIKNNINISFIFYIPSKAPFNLGETDEKEGNKMKLYSKGILIDDTKTDYFPEWMNFCLGIIEIDGLQLNINRQSHIDSNLVKIVKNKITIEFIELMIKLKNEKYNFFCTLNHEFGECIKMGIIEELSNRINNEEEQIGILHAKKLFKLLLFNTSKNRKVCFDDYVRDMPLDQIGIYYIAGGNEKILTHSPFIEKIISRPNDKLDVIKKNYEIIFFTDNIDEHIKNYLVGYKKNENEIIIGIEDPKDEESLKLHDDINFEDLNTKRFLDVSRCDDLLIDFDKTNYIPEKNVKKLIEKLKLIYKNQKIHLHDIKSCDKFESIPAIVVSQVNISAQFENCLNNQNISKRKEQYDNVLKRKNLLISPSNETIKYLYEQLIKNNININDEHVVKFCKDMYSSAMLIGGYQIDDYITYARNNFDYACKSVVNNLN
jgi:HSP90 family molecular chaperone